MYKCCSENVNILNNAFKKNWMFLIEMMKNGQQQLSSYIATHILIETIQQNSVHNIVRFHHRFHFRAQNECRR